MVQYENEALACDLQVTTPQQHVVLGESLLQLACRVAQKVVGTRVVLTAEK